MNVLVVLLFVLMFISMPANEFSDENTEDTSMNEFSPKEMNHISETIGPLGMMGNWTYGICQTVLCKDNILYISSGSHLMVYDVSNKLSINKLEDIWFPEQVQDIQIVDDTVFVYSGRYSDPGAAALHIFNASDKSNLQEIGNYTFTGSASDCIVDEDLVYMASPYDGLRIVNISDITNPQLELFYSDYSYYGLEYDNGLLYVSRTQFGVKVINVTDLSSISVLTDETPYRSDDVFANGTEIFVASQTNGLVIANVSNPTNLTVISSVGSWYGRGIIVSNNYAYISTLNGFHIVNVADIFNPILEPNFIDIDGEECDIDGDYAYLAGGTGCYIIDISDPANPVIVNTIRTESFTRDVDVEDNYAYLVSNTLGLQIIDVSDVTNYQKIAEYPGYMQAIKVQDSVAYIGGGGFTILDVSNPYTPILLGELYLSTSIQDIYIDGSFAYLATYHTGLNIIDISDKNNPVLVSTNSDTSEAFGIDYDGQYLYLATRELGLRIMDISDIEHPTIASELDLTGECYSVQVVDDLAFIANWGRGLDIVNVSNPLNPFLVNRYSPVSQIEDVAVEGEIAHVVTYYQGTYRILNLTNILDITEICSTDLISYGCAVDLENGLAYLCVYMGNLVSYEHDADGDGITSTDEYLYGTNAGLYDSDHDLISDFDEIFVYSTNPTDSDSDHDDLDDYEELFVYGTNPLYFDTDLDLMGDGWEIHYGLNATNPADATEDPDLDLLLNVYEYQNNTNPHLNDTDFDNLDDYEEIVVYGTNPLSPDSDFDTLDDWTEIHVYGTNPLSNDSDSDLMPDPWEIAHGLNPVNASDAYYDEDNDLVVNVNEYLAGTDPFYDDYVPNLLDLPDLKIYEQIGGELVWTATEGNPHYYEIFIDGTLVRRGWWNSSSEEIRLNLNGLVPGEYDFRLTVSDVNWNNATDYVTVTIMPESEIPLISSPSDIEYFFGESSVYITWDILDDNPSSYIIYVNGTQIQTGPWDPSTLNISIEVSGNPIGVYLYTLEIFDEDGHSIHDIVVVTCKEDTTTPTDTSTSETITDIQPWISTLTLMISLGSAGIIIIVIIVILRNRPAPYEG